MTYLRRSRDLEYVVLRIPRWLADGSLAAMHLALDARPTTTTTGEPWTALLATIADDTRVDGYGDRHTLVTELTQTLYERYYQHHATPHLYRAPEDADVRHAPVDTSFRRRLTETLVRTPDERGWADGYLFVSGIFGPAHRADQARVLLHLLPSSAPEVFARIVRLLDALGLPFSAQVLDHPLAYGRPDAAVITVARELVPTVVRLAVSERCRASSAFGRSVPAFTRQVLPGVAVADVPTGGGDLGRRRCRTIAEALVDAGPSADRAARRTAVRAALEAEGLDLSALHLNPGQPEFELGRV